MTSASRWQRIALAGVGSLGLAFWQLSMAATPASAATACPSPLTQSARISPAGGNPFILCSGRIPSFDGTPLDTDLAIPATVSGARPLIVMMHGWGNSKTDWESTTLAGNGANTFHWNNAWFASHGFAVLTYSARGFHHSCGKDADYSYATDPACSGKASWTHLSDRRWEIHDTQYLVGLLVDAGVARPNQIVATGESYGGGQSWLLALAQDQVVASSSIDPANPQLSAWTSPNGTPIKLAAAVPQFPWTDLVSSLQPNGLASDGFFGAPPPGPDGSPIGVEKQSYVSGLFALGAGTAQYAVPGSDPTADLATWFAGINVGEPYSANPDVGTALTQIGGAFRSPYAVPVPPKSAEIPVLFLQGMTDPLFPAIQGLQEMNRLLSVDPGYPVWSIYGDLGHSYADNPPAFWQAANTQANAWLTSILRHQTPSQPRVTAVTTPCLPGQSLVSYTGPLFQDIPNTVLGFSSAIPATTTNLNTVQPEGAQTDPITNSGCRVIASGTDPDVASWTFTPASAATLLGSPIVSAQVTVTGVDAEIAARLWDVDPSTGKQALVARAVYRINVPSSGVTIPVAFELSANAWQLACGHQLKLELTQDDAPNWRPDNEPSSLSYTGLGLRIPAVTGSTC